MSEFKYHAIPCPNCGNLMDARSKRCAVCSSAQTDSKGRHVPCPGCGNPMTPRAKLCRACTHRARERQVEPLTRTWWGVIPDYSAIPADFLYTFTGFFTAEGHVAISVGKSQTTVVSAMGLRRDDAAVLQLAQQTFGGSFRYALAPHNASGYVSQPQAFWYLQGLGKNLIFLSLLLKYSAAFSAKKRRDAEIVLEYIRWRMARPQRLTPEDRVVMAAYGERLKQSRQYQPGA
jgi:predicted RNA-binding Zn-ribbon protein involved in translation (DUF1610 family)